MNTEIFHTFLIKYAEIGVKGKNRFLFEDALVMRIRDALKPCSGKFLVYKHPGRIFVDCREDFDFDETVDALKHVFGVVGICPVLMVQDEGFDALGDTVREYIAQTYPELTSWKPSAEEMAQAGTSAEVIEETLKAIGTDAEKEIKWQKVYPSIRRSSEQSKTFKMYARRNRKNYPKDSMEINMDLGEVLLDSYPSLKVDVHKPELIINVEINDYIYIYSEILPGPGGMPVGTGGKGMLLLSGGIDSPVAGWMISKRGVTLDAVYFHAPPYTSDRAKQKVIDLAAIISRYTGPINLHVVNFTDIQLAIYEKCPHEELTIIMRRYMMRIAEHIAKECGAMGLVTGESIGQVASQTMASMMVTNEVCTIPVYRPLVALDKQEIVEISEKIGTYETSILPFEDCCTIFVAKHPVTKPNLNVICRHETNLNDVIDDLLAKVYETDEVWHIEGGVGTLAEKE